MGLLDEIKASKLKYSCPFCDKKMFSKNAQKYHRKYAHKNENKKDDNDKLPCEFCGKIFTWKNRGNLKAHIKQVHNFKDYDISDMVDPSVTSTDTNSAANFINFLSSLHS